jgi:15-cis-phytoene synthase
MTVLQQQTWEYHLLSLAREAWQSIVPSVSVPVHDRKLLDRAYAHCESVTAKHSHSFHMASSLLPTDKRRAVRALYAFCRATDDIVDCPKCNPELSLRVWRRKILSPEFNISTDLIAIAWADIRRRYGIPLRYAEQLIDGVARDLYQHRYATFEELAAYAYGVASTVGLMSMHIIGFTNHEAISYAIKLGVALQITNILRDVGEDWRAGRVYLPQEELAAFDLTESDLAAGRVDDRWRNFMQFQIDRNRRLYMESQPGIRLLEKTGHFAIVAAGELYSAILDDIEAHDYDVFSRRAHVTTWGKLSRLPRIWWHSRGMNDVQ